MARFSAIEAARDQLQAFNAADWERFQDGHASDYTCEEHATARRLGSAEAVEACRAWRQAFPDLTGTVTNAFEGGDWAALEIMWTGTHQGELVTPTGAVAPTGRPITLPGVLVARVREGRVSDMHSYFDLMTLLNQVGALVSPANV
jgi:steroid delta-isomerase-like uncharacterized protein